MYSYIYLCIPIYIYVFLYISMYSYTYLCIPIYIYVFLYTSNKLRDNFAALFIASHNPVAFITTGSMILTMN